LAAGADVRETLRGIAVGFAPDSLALAITHAGAMGMTDGLVAERALRQARLGRADHGETGGRRASGPSG
jgi:hypothetical protein